MEEKYLQEGLQTIGCDRELCDRIVRECDRQRQLQELKVLRCRLIEEMHEAQKKVDCLDHLIRIQKKGE